MAVPSYIMLFFTTLCLSALPQGLSSNIFVFPFGCGINSRLFNMERMANVLADHGHNVSLIINSRTRHLIKSKKITVVEFAIPKDRKTILPNDEVFQDIWANQSLTGDIMDFIVYEYVFPYCISLLEQRSLIDSLKEQKFDLFLLDANEHCGMIVADYFGIPTLLYSNPGFSGDSNHFYPVPPSFVPSPDFGVDVSDRMNFWERVVNFGIRNIQQVAMYDRFHSPFESLRLQYGFGAEDERKNSYKHSPILATIDFALDLPRPIMPHIIPISAWFLTDANPLKGTWAAIVDGAPKEGIIIVSFGSIMSPFGRYKDEILAKVFASLPQRVIWKYTGPKLENLGSNTLISDWLPQNDLLAHPKVKLFITHCGMSSTYEAIQHKVPIVAIPIGFDQPYNARVLVSRAKMGVLLNIIDVNEQTLRSAIDEVLGNENYVNNAKKMAALVKDKPVPAKELILYWVDYVIRHKGAKHLISFAAHELNFLQYHSVDVVVFLAAVLLSFLTLFIGLVYCLMKFICRNVLGQGKVKHKPE